MEQREVPVVLVADDESAVRELVCEVLETAGFQAVPVSDGEEVVARAVAARPDLIVLDVLMPGIDGYTALMRLQGERQTAHIPVVILTGRAEPIYGTLSAGVGAVAHLTKPFSPRHLTDLVRRVLAPAPGVTRDGIPG